MLILFNKPFGVVSQFRPDGLHPTLSSYFENPALRVAGRLDADSEGLLLLTDQGWLNARLTQPQEGVWKTYWAQVEGIPQPEQLEQLIQGVTLKDGLTRPAQARQIEMPSLWARNPPIRYRQNVPDSWLEIKICEGRNRQVRRMTAAVGLPTLRLVRMAIGDFELNALQPGQWQSVALPEQDQHGSSEQDEPASQKTETIPVKRRSAWASRTRQSTQKRQTRKP